MEKLKVTVEFENDKYIFEYEYHESDRQTLERIYLPQDEDETCNIVNHKGRTIATLLSETVSIS